LKLRILHVIETCGPGGAETVFTSLAGHLNANRFESRAAISGTGWVADRLQTLSVPTTLGRSHSSGLADVRLLRSLVREHHIDLMHAHLLGSGIHATLAGKLTRIPVVVTLHGELDLSTGNRWWPLKRLLLNQADHVVFVSNWLQRRAAAAYGVTPQHASVIHNGIPLPPSTWSRASARGVLGILPDDIVIGAIGNVRPAKGYDVLLRAAALLLDRNTRVRFLVAGEWSEPLFSELKELQEELGLATAVRFLGFVPNPDRVLAGFDLFVLPSRSEGFSITTVQAMAAGVPVVATRSGGPEEILEDGVTGTLVPANDPQSLAASLEKVIRDPVWAGIMATQAHEVVRDRFTLDRMVQSYERLYEDLINQGRRSPVHESA
jgi:glycosyltransferase involved in cell wall biosynthesis